MDAGGRLQPMLATVGFFWQFLFLKRLFKKHGFWANKKYWLANKKSWQFFFQYYFFFAEKVLKILSLLKNYLSKSSAKPTKKIGQPTKLVGIFFFIVKLKIRFFCELIGQQRWPLFVCKFWLFFSFGPTLAIAYLRQTKFSFILSQ